MQDAKYLKYQIQKDVLNKRNCQLTQLFAGLEQKEIGSLVLPLELESLVVLNNVEDNPEESSCKRKKKVQKQQ